MSVLTKPSKLQFDPGAPYVPGNPGRPARPGYFVTETYTISTPHYAWVTSGSPDVNGSVASEFKIIGYITETVTTKTWIPPVEAIPPTPSTAARPPAISEMNIGWNSGAETGARVTGQANLSFQVPVSAVGVVVGLSDKPRTGGYTNIAHGLYISSGRVRVVENGVLKTGFVRYASGQQFAIQRSGDAVTYSVGGAPLATSTDTTTGPVFGVASLYMAGDSVVDATMTAVSAYGGMANASMLPASSFAVGNDAGDDYGRYAFAAGSMQPPTSESTGRVPVSVANSMPAAVSFAADRDTGYAAGRMLAATGDSTGTQYSTWAIGSMPAPAGLASHGSYAEARATMPAPTGLASGGELAPAFAVAYGAMAFAQSAAISIVGTVGQATGSAKAMTGISAEGPYGIASGSMLAPTGQAGDAKDVSVTQLTNKPPVVRMEMLNMTGRNAAQLVNYRPVVRLFTGISAPVRNHAPVVVATGTVTTMARAALVNKRPVVVASVLVPEGVTARLVNAKPAVSMHFGAHASLVNKLPTVQCGMTTGGIFTVTLVAPRAYGAVTFSATVHDLLSAELTNYAGYVSLSIGAQFVCPAGYVTATMRSSAAPEYEAYAVNMRHATQQPFDEVTHYTNYPFTHVVRYQGRYYAAGSSGLYLLEGATDAGAAIPYEVRTHQDNLEHDGFKTLASAYISGKLSGDAGVTVLSAEGDEDEYAYTSPQGDTVQNHRVKFGRGRKSRHFALAVAGSGIFEVDDLRLEINKLKRNL